MLSQRVELGRVTFEAILGSIEALLSRQLHGQLENTESGNGIRERKRKCTVRAHARDLDEWAGQPINGRIEIIFYAQSSLCAFMHTVLAKETDRVISMNSKSSLCDC